MNNHSKHELVEEGIPLQNRALSHPRSLAFFPDGWRQMSLPPLLQRSMTGTGTLSSDTAVCKWRRMATWKPLVQSRWFIMPHRDDHKHTAQHQHSKRHRPGMNTHWAPTGWSPGYLIHTISSTPYNQSPRQEIPNDAPRGGLYRSVWLVHGGGRYEFNPSSQFPDVHTLPHHLQDRFQSPWFSAM